QARSSLRRSPHRPAGAARMRRGYWGPTSQRNVMAQRFDGRVAVVTGAGTGIGFEIGRRFVAEGGAVVLNDVDRERVASALTRIQGGGGERCVGVTGDAGEIDFTRELVDRAVRAFGRVDAVVANAGLTLWCDFFECESAEFERIMDLNLR